jgi:single-strand DNA-binding protein
MKQLTIIGNLGYDAVIKESNGSKFIDFSVAVNEKYKKQDGTMVESTDWINCTHKHLGLAPFLKKGDKVMVQGNMKINVYQDKNKQWRAGVNLSAFNIMLLSNKKEEATNEQPAEAPAAASSDQPADDLPF